MLGTHALWWPSNRDIGKRFRDVVLKALKCDVWHHVGIST